METNQYLRWTKIAVSIVSFGMIYPNAITEGMKQKPLSPYTDGSPEKEIKGR